MKITANDVFFHRDVTVEINGSSVPLIRELVIRRRQTVSLDQD